MVPTRLFAAVAVALITLVALPPSAELSAQNRPMDGYRQIVEVTDDTINPFLPTERGLGDCISALPKPGCGSEARGGWRQWLVLLTMVTGLTFIGWRVVRAVRGAGVSPHRTPDATTAPDDHGDAPEP